MNVKLHYWRHGVAYTSLHATVRDAASVAVRDQEAGAMYADKIAQNGDLVWDRKAVSDLADLDALEALARASDSLGQ